MKTKNYYKKLIELSKTWCEDGEECCRLESTQIGVISGGADYSEEGNLREQGRVNVLRHIQLGIAEGRRLSRMLEIAREYSFNKCGGVNLLTDTISDREFHREWAKHNG